MGDIIYEYGVESFGVQEAKGGRKVPTPPVSRRQQELKRLVQERRQLKKQWKKGSVVEKGGIEALKADIKTRLSSLRRAENLRKRRRKKEQTRTRFYKDPFKFLKSLFPKEKSGALKTTKKDLEEHLRIKNFDSKGHEHLAIPSDIPPIEPPEHHIDTSPPTWKEVENIVRRARSASAPGPNGVPYKVYKNAPDVLRFLWRLMRTAWQKKIIPKVWHFSTTITTLLKAYFQDLQFCFTTSEFTTSWQCLNVGLYGDGVLKLPLTSLTEKFKCAKTRFQMTLNESRDPVGRWTRWESVEKRKISCKDLWAMEARRLSFSIRATYILTGCKTSLTQGRYTWRHNQVLKNLASALEEKRAATNSLPTPAASYPLRTTFVREGAKPPKSSFTPSEREKLRLARDWKMLADIGRQLVFPPEIVTTTLRPDMVLWSSLLKKVFIIELTVPWEDSVGEAYEPRHLRYGDLATEARHLGWNTEVRPVEVGCRSFVATSTTRLLKDLGIKGQSQRSAIRAVSEAAEGSSQWLWMKRINPSWAPNYNNFHNIIYDDFFLTQFTWTVCAWADGGRQKRAWIIESFTIEEENPGPFPYILGKIQLERSYLYRYQLKGQGVDSDPKGILDIDKDGNVLVYGKVDFENEKGIQVIKSTFEARDHINNEVDTKLGVHIQILDINDHAPKFQQSVYEVTVDESHSQGKDVVTVLAFDEDDPHTNNGTFDLTIKSVTPTPDNVKFYIKQQKGQRSGTVYFNGCLNYEKAQKYTILVEAKDKGEKIQLSSTSTLKINILDNNNNLPVFSGKTGPGKVKEREAGVEVLRLQVTDKDTRGSKAWKAKYTIHGDKKEQFKIETDPDTNEGILTVVKQMDYEEQTYQNLSISVQNEIPYFSCKVKNQVENAKWEVDVIPQNSGMSVENLYNTIPVTIYVEDVNDPPVFIPPVKHIQIMENIAVGTSLTTFTAKDMDGSHKNTFKFVKGEDIDGWITVDAKTGLVSTNKILDRESPFGINSTYRATLYAVDDGVPPLTGTGTLFIHLNDQNDNIPMLEVNAVNICLDTEPTVANITAVDLDLPPYSSPFHYELLGDVKDKWRVEPTHGTTVSLIKEHSVHSGHHLLQIKILDQQGMFSIQNLTVRVCDCSIDPNCKVRTARMAKIGPTAAWIVVLTFLFFIAMCLMVLLISCKAEKKMIEMDYAFGRLIQTNTENPGTDCKVKHNKQEALQPVFTDQMFIRSMQRSSTRSSYRENFKRSSIRSSGRFFYGKVSYPGNNLAVIINKKLLALQTREEEFVVYEPHYYADEGQAMDNAELDALSIPENDFHPEMLINLDNRFSELATISRPDLMQR
ncbi:cadherin-like protein 26 [Siphateles boraxobius]|uniref:cadherin-like protein 26 n=1 Tax=Siphateles boraxobius TaxID=180520 RepID=UPI0040639841